jgi:hypothetical protein
MEHPTSDPARDAVAANRDIDRVRGASLKWPGIIAVAAVFAGWFLLEFVLLNIGPLHQQFPFYDIPAIIARPLRLIFGVDDAALAITIPFAVLCLAVLGVALLPQLSSRRFARFGACAPLALMVIGAVILWYQAAHETFPPPDDAGDVASAFVNLANALTKPARTIVSKHLTLGAGAYLSGIGALYLAYHGLRGARPR